MKLLLMVLSTSFVAWFVERHELRVVYPFDQDYSTPAEAGLAMSEARFATRDGESLILWQSAAAAGKPTILYLPGNAGTLKGRAGRFDRLIARGYGVVAVAYRGSSGSSGTPDEATLTADALDVAAAITTGPLILYGESLGGAVAIKVAASGLGDAVVLEAPFTSIPDVVAEQYPAEDMAHLFTQVWNSADTVPAVTQPLLVIHGAEDSLIPVTMGQAIHAAAGSTDKRLVIVPEQGHHALWTVAVQREVYDFFDRF